MNNVLDWYKGV